MFPRSMHEIKWLLRTLDKSEVSASSCCISFTHTINFQTDTTKMSVKGELEIILIMNSTYN